MTIGQKKSKEIFQSLILTDKYTDIITFSDLTSGERYTGLDRITNANDIHSEP